ncbi:MAG: DNA-binding protein [Candidatus Thermoplasmatota archaeon]|jgi:programmed cell death protein 5|nr:DNA-binding protein [Candidatus Thermoplasmatota archaeon]MCL5987357.1 DNA-binding protein [Candidatus Thermoplasmatota archaeon]
MDNDRDLEEIRRRKMEEIQSSNSQAQSREAERQQEAERAMRLQILRQILDPVARERLANIRLVKPELAENVENQLVQLYSMGRIKKVINDDELKQILSKLTETKRETKIERR